MKGPQKKKVFRRCAHCGRAFAVEPRVGRRHRFCSRPECAHASHLRAQRKWRRSPAGRDYYRDGESTLRVREWRRAHPGRGRRRDRALPGPLAAVLREFASQDSMDPLLALLIGLVAERTNLAQQDAMAIALRQLILRGHAILLSPTELSPP